MRVALDRRRRHRRRLGGKARRERRRRRRLRPASGRGAARARGARERRARVGAADARAARAWHRDVRRVARGGRARRRPRPGERAGGRGAQAPPARRDRHGRSRPTRSSARRRRVCCRRGSRPTCGTRSASSSRIRSTPSTCSRSSRSSRASSTSEDAVARAVDVLRVARHEAAASSAREIDGFVADRLLEALWREALWLVHDDVATVEEIDDAIRFGAGLRWAQMGTFLTYRIAGGEDGMRHFLAQFGPALAWPWTKLTDVPELTRRADREDRGAVGRAGRRAVGARARAHPRRQPRRAPAGSALAATAPARVLHEHEARLFERAAAARRRTDPDASAPPLRVRRRSVLGRLQRPHDRGALRRRLRRTRRTPSCATSALDAELPRQAVTAPTRSRRTSGTSARSPAFEPLVVETQVLGADEKRLHLFHDASPRPERRRRSRRASTCSLHVDTAAGRACSLARARRDAASRRPRPLTPRCPSRPKGAGRAIAMG